ncbi:hypothetical protein ElyMa_003214900 [Elysia marginata]|uniref:MULE transposase domain-containing protein n=1 Tax=Elysia marginata TaxID=1093978 RepID=A0AAV4J6A1_9GAST|nr:hypothetical protein ElyMa_003214900 [Elysia marginata]
MESTVRVSLRYYPTKRNQPTYGCFNFSNEKNFTLSPATVHTDLEVTMISAVHYIWPEAVVALCNFHLCQASYRKIQAFNLTRDYRDVKSLVGRWLRLVFALPTLSVDSVRECFLTTLTDLMPDTTDANLFADYIYGTCSQGLGPNDNSRAATQRLAGIPGLSLSRSHYTDTDPTSRGPDCSAVFRTRDLLATERSHYQLSYLGPPR